LGELKHFFVLLSFVVIVTSYLGTATERGNLFMLGVSWVSVLFAEALCECGGQGRGNLTNVQCKAIGNWHNESSLYNEYMPMKMKK
jgi:hypothetical protein